MPSSPASSDASPVLRQVIVETGERAEGAIERGMLLPGVTLAPDAGLRLCHGNTEGWVTIEPPKGTYPLTPAVLEAAPPRQHRDITPM